ncbi:MAG: Smr/MutS family protein [Desulfobacteraceae bacterium]|jgi:DNA-nicking Smr family endonuclease
MMEPVEIPIDGILDLHTFNPRELPLLIDDYLEACREKGIFSVRIIHGKGTGVQKARVRSLLRKHPLVREFKDAPAEAGGWGATVVELVR